MAKKAVKVVKMDTLTKRLAILLAADKDLKARAAKALAAIHPDDRDQADMSAWENASDTMIERGMPKARERSFAYRRSYVRTLEMIADCAPDYGYRRAA